MTGPLPSANLSTTDWLKRYKLVRAETLHRVSTLQTEDFVAQPIVDVSPPKWHLAHTTWFFENFILKPHLEGYQVFHEHFGYLFNSYYEGVGKRTVRDERGFMTRPTVKEVKAYRAYVDEHVAAFLQSQGLSESLKYVFELGLQHEQQHQELLCTDTKYIMAQYPIFPAYLPDSTLEQAPQPHDAEWLSFEEGIYEIGHQGNDFCFDNELGRHRQFLEPFALQNKLVTNEEYLEFISSGGYSNFEYWPAEGWDWVQRTEARAPMYWLEIEGKWHRYNLNGLQVIPLRDAVTHINYFEAQAFAAWKGLRLPTEFEWEAAHKKLDYGKRWEWTQSAYLPYPSFNKAPGAVGEYNGKFMSGQMVLRGSSCATPKGHARPTYRNFFHPHLQWQFTGIRLAKTL